MQEYSEELALDSERAAGENEQFTEISGGEERVGEASASRAVGKGRASIIGGSGGEAIGIEMLIKAVFQFIVDPIGREKERIRSDSAASSFLNVHYHNLKHPNFSSQSF